MNTGALVSAAIDELLNPAARLKDTLLKVQALAGLIGNQELRSWVEAELNGYYSEDGGQIPDHRRIAASPRANLTTVYGGGWQPNQLIPTEYLGREMHKLMTHRFLPNGVGSLEAMIGKTDAVKIDLPHAMCQNLNKTIYSESDWCIHSAWQVLSIHDIEGILSTIRSKLLDLLIQLKAKFGNDIPLQSLQQKLAVNDAVNQALHSLHVTNGTVNILGAAATQSNISASDNATVGVAQGENITQTLSSEQSQSLTDLVGRLKQELLADPAFDAQREDIDSEIERIEQQLKRPEPKKSLLERSFKALHDLVKDSIGSTAGHAVFELIKQAPLLIAAGEHLSRHA